MKKPKVLKKMKILIIFEDKLDIFENKLIEINNTKTILDVTVEKLKNIYFARIVIKE